MVAVVLPARVYDIMGSIDSAGRSRSRSGRGLGLTLRIWKSGRSAHLYYRVHHASLFTNKDLKGKTKTERASGASVILEVTMFEQNHNGNE
jgi:hypothetical protein